MTKMPISTIFLTLLIVVMLSVAALASTSAQLCSQDIEGTYGGTLDGFEVRVNLFCVDKEHIEATVCPVVAANGVPSIDSSTNLNTATIDGDQVILSNFLVGNADRPSGSSKTSLSYAVLDLSSLLNGKVRGRYMTTFSPRFMTLNATRIQKLPQVFSVTKAPLKASTVWGAYSIVGNQRWQGEVVDFDILAGTPIITVTNRLHRIGFHLTVGPVWDESGVISLASPEGNGGEPDDKKLFYIRGHFLDEKHLEFYLLSPANGVEGPLLAIRN